MRGKKRELESNLRRMENELETVSQSNSELNIRIVEKEQQYKEVRTQVESMRVTYEKHQKELNERLERTVQENSSMMDLQRALDEERRRVDELQICKYNKLTIYLTLKVGISNQLFVLKSKMRLIGVS